MLTVTSGFPPASVLTSTDDKQGQLRDSHSLRLQDVASLSTFKLVIVLNGCALVLTFLVKINVIQ